MKWGTENNLELRIKLRTPSPNSRLLLRTIDAMGGLFMASDFLR